MRCIGTIRAGARLIAAFSSLALVGTALADEATREYYESLKPGRQLAKNCFNEFGQLVLTPKNIGLCADLPKAVALGFDITPRQELARECYDRDGKLVITPRNVDLCASLPTAAIVSIPPDPASVDDDRNPSSDDQAPAGGAATTGASGSTGGGTTGTSSTGDSTTGTGGAGSAKGNKGHGNGDEGGCSGGGCSDDDNPGKGRN